MAIKIARLYGHSKGINCPQIIVMEKGFHGRTLGALSASNPKIH
ncbi:MAG: aspartate aminotransferase family protein, partial [Candidatus Parabeggiatoa sp. nov. 2]